MGEADGGGRQVRGWSMLHAPEGDLPSPTAGKGTSPRALQGLVGEAKGQCPHSMIPSDWALGGGSLQSRG